MGKDHFALNFAKDDYFSISVAFIQVYDLILIGLIYHHLSIYDQSDQVMVTFFIKILLYFLVQQVINFLIFLNHQLCINLAAVPQLILKLIYFLKVTTYQLLLKKFLNLMKYFYYNYVLYYYQINLRYISFKSYLILLVKANLN